MIKHIAVFVVVAILIIGCGPSEDLGTWKVNVTENPATEAPPQQASSTNDECGNPYYPVVNGAEWTYKDSDSQFTHSLTSGDNGAFTINVESGADTFIIQGICQQGGDINLVDGPGSSLTFSGDSGSSTMTTTKNDGVSLPGDIQQGDDWSQTVGVQVTAGNQTMDFTIDSTFKALGYETVTVPAGTFNALKVEESSDMGGPNPTVITLWYAQYIGPIKTVINVGEQPIVQELVSYSIP